MEEQKFLEGCKESNDHKDSIIPNWTPKMRKLVAHNVQEKLDIVMEGPRKENLYAIETSEINNSFSSPCNVK
jgi:hypothetical protein